jgi:hypothetical protein
MYQNSMQQYTNAQMLAEMVWAMCSAQQKMSPYKIEGVRGDIVDGIGINITCFDGDLHCVPLLGGQNKKSADAAALPGGGCMPLSQQIN